MKDENFLIGVNSKGELFTKDNLPYYFDETGKLVFKRTKSKPTATEVGGENNTSN